MKFNQMILIRSRWRFLPLAALLVVALGWPGCGSKKTPASSFSLGKQGASEATVLRVGSSTYRAADFSRYVEALIGKGGGKLSAPTLSQLFDKFIDDKLLLQAAADEHVSLSPEEKQEFLKKLKDEGWTPDEEKAAITSDSGPLNDRMRVEKYVAGLVQGLTVSEEEVSVYYEKNKNQFFLPERYKVSQILLPSEAAAVDVLERLKGASEDDFRAAAKAQSVGPEAAEGGQMGVFQKGQLPPDMEASIFALQEGGISPVVGSSYGFHIFRLDKKFEAEQTSLQDASESIKLEILDQKVKSLVARRLLDLRESLDWTVFSENLSFPYQKVKS